MSKVGTVADTRSGKAAQPPLSPEILDEAARALARHSPDGMVILRSPGDWICVFINEAAARQFGPDGPTVGRPMLEAFPAPARGLIASALDEAMRSGEPRDVLAPWQHDDAILEMRIVPLSDAVAIHFRDISVLALRERQQAAAATLGLRAISGIPLDDLYTAAVELVQSALLVDFVYVVQLRAGNELIVRAHVGRTDINPVGRIIEADRSIAAYVVRTGQPVVTVDFAAEKRYLPPPAAREVSARSAAAVPVRGRHGAFGALVVMNRAPHEFRPEDIAFLQTAANVLAAAVDRAADEVAIRAAEAQLLASLQAAKMVAWEWSSLSDELQLVGATHAFGLPGVSRLRGEMMLELIHPDDRGGYRAALRRAISDETDLRMRFRIIRRDDGRTVWFEAQGTVVDGGRAVRGLAADITPRVEAEAALRRQEELFRAITEFGRELIAIINESGSMTYISPSGARMLGHEVLSMLGRPLIDLIHPDDRARVTAALTDITAEANAMRAFTARALTEAGQWISIAGTAYNMLHHPAVRGIVVNARDITEMVDAQEALSRSQEQLHQALKMEAVGRLAGGIAHDFNNLLTAIRGYSDMLAAGLRPSDPLRADVQEIQRAADRAAGLTHQLLAFSRRQVLRPDRLDLSAVVRDLERMVRRLIGEDIELGVRAEATRTVLVDRGQIEQVILNLVINARDAMPTGGHLTIAARDFDVTGPPAIREGAPPPGRYAMIRVEDSGGGIPAEIVDRVFEPFFTTKGPGKGTGLGLSTAYGIVKQSGGFIDVTSVEGAGTTFRILLPEAEQGEPRAALPEAPRAPMDHSGGETILLVEDADAVRQVVRRALTKMGYRVLEASNGPQAIGVALEHTDEIDLVLSDFVMPHMGGRELIDRLHELGLRPKILIMSGYIDDALLRGGGFPPGAAFIEKPFTAEGIGRKVREVLDGVHTRTAPRVEGEGI